MEETREIMVARRVYVGNLSWRTSWQDLKDHFGQVGQVRYADVMREAGPGSRSKGCGIVEFETPEEAAAAITQLHDTELEGRKIFVREDREDYELREEGGRGGGGDRYGGGPPPRRGGRGGDGGGSFGWGGGSGDRLVTGGGDRYRSRSPVRRPFSGGGGGREAVAVGRRVYVEGLPFEITWQDLKDHFKSAGRVLHADVLTDPTGRSNGCGTVEFESAADALHSISALSNTTLGGSQIHVREDREGAAGARGPPPSRYGGGGGPPPGYDRGPPPSYDRGGGGSGAPGTQVVVHGLPYRMSWQDLKDLCRPAGAVVRADIMTGDDGRSKGYGIVAFGTPSDAQAALELLNGMELEGRRVTAKFDRFA